MRKARELGLQTAGLTTAPWSADNNIHPIFDEFFKALEPKFKDMTRGQSDPRFPWLPATGYADDMECKENWHFVNSEENRVRLASYWTATLFALDCAWNAWKVGLELSELPEEGFDDLRRNVNFLFENCPESYKDRISKVTEIVFGTSRKHIIPEGCAFTAEEVRLRQPVTEDDVKNLDPKMFPSAPSGPPPDLATGGGAPSSSVNWPRLPARPPQKGIHPLVLYGRPSSGVWVYDGHQCRRRGSARHPFQWGGI